MHPHLKIYENSYFLILSCKLNLRVWEGKLRCPCPKECYLTNRTIYVDSIHFHLFGNGTFQIVKKSTLSLCPSFFEMRSRSGKYLNIFRSYKMKTLATLVEGSLYKMPLTLRIAFCLIPGRCLLCAHWLEGHFLNIRETNQICFGGFLPKAALHRKFWWSVSHYSHGNVFTWLSGTIWYRTWPTDLSLFFFF